MFSILSVNPANMGYPFKMSTKKTVRILEVNSIHVDFNSTSEHRIASRQVIDLPLRETHALCNPGYFLMKTAINRPLSPEIGNHSSPQYVHQEIASPLAWGTKIKICYPAML